MTHTEGSSKFSPGMPVEVGGIESQLAALWNASGASKVRASLVNLVIYSEAPDAIEKNTPLLAALASGHAFRALLIQVFWFSVNWKKRVEELKSGRVGFVD